MAWTSYDTPGEFFGPGYAFSGSAITIDTATNAGNTVGTTFSCAVADTILFAAAHGLKVGDRIKVTDVGTLPTGLTDGTIYYVKTVPSSTTITVAATKNGSTVAITVGGTSDNTIQAMGPLDELSDEEASASAGDARAVVYAICDAVYRKWLGIPTADRPANMTCSMSPSMDPTTGRITKYYTFSFVLEPSGLEVVPE